MLNDANSLSDCNRVDNLSAYAWTTLLDRPNALSDINSDIEQEYTT